MVGRRDPKDVCLRPSDLLLTRSATEQFAYAYVILIFAIFGIVGNILNLIVLLSPVMRSRSQLLSYLAIVDVLFLTSMVPHSLAHYWAFIGQYYFRLVYMKIKMHLIGFSNWTSAAAIWLILMICIERLIGIRYPFFVKKYWKTGNDKRRTILVIFVMVATFLLTFYTHFSRYTVSKLFCNNTQLHFMHISTSIDKFGNETNPYPIWVRDLMQPCTIIHAINGVLIPTSVVIIANILLLRTLKIRGRFLVSFNENNQQQSPNYQMSQAKLERNITYTACAIVTCFTITQAPSAILLSTLSHISFGNPSWQFHLIHFADCMVVIGKSLNFVLFCLTSHTFRQRLYSITKLKRRFSESKHFTGMTTFYTSVSANSRSRVTIDASRQSRYSRTEAAPKIKLATSYSSLSCPSKKDRHRLSHLRRTYSADSETKLKRKAIKRHRLSEPHSPL